MGRKKKMFHSLEPSMTSLHKNPIERRNAGRRVELIYTSDPYTNLKPGDKGTYQHANTYRLDGNTETQHSIAWDNGSTLMLIEGVDKFKFVDGGK